MKNHKVQINPIVNNESFIRSQFNLAISGNVNLDIHVLNYKLNVDLNAHAVYGFKDKGIEEYKGIGFDTFDDWNQMLQYTVKFCEKVYQNDITDMKDIA